MRVDPQSQRELCLVSDGLFALRNQKNECHNKIVSVSDNQIAWPGPEP